MKRALEEGSKGFGFVSPNPLVGCVVLNSKLEMISTGFHEMYGGAHAEMNAIKNLTHEQLDGAHVVVTLEPCAHVGQTPSCAQELAKLPIASVTYAVKDPNPLVSGKGIEILEKAGIAVLHLETTQHHCEDLAEIFLWNMREKRAFVALKMASSLDGQIALKSGESQWITGEKSRKYSHYLRAGYDAILIGRNTLVVDDPMLNIRHPNFQGKKNKVVLLDPEGKLLKNISHYKISEYHQKENIIFAIRDNIVVSTDYKIIPVKTLLSGSLDLIDLTQKLYEEKICSLYVEGGAQTYSEFLSQKAFQRLYLFQAPVIIGTKNGKSWSESFSVSRLKEKLLLNNMKSEKIGDDLFITARV
jgi:diaminohydroxyphosphoribosylaminopyrimidine deaminase/5-amino-6-(5-phosphoribosylamino)uracil reductase